MNWLETHRPKTKADYLGVRSDVNSMFRFFESYLDGMPFSDCLILHGPPGCGKTSLVLAAANEYNLTLNEFNASDLRRKADLEPLIGLSNTSPMTGNSMRAILLDEADGLRNWKLIERLTTEPPCPIVLTCNDLTKIDYGLRKRSLVFEVSLPSIRHKRKLIDRICDVEGIKVPDKIRNKVAEVSRTYRSTIMTLQSSILVKKTAKVQERDVDGSEHETIRRLLTGQSVNTRALNLRKVMNYAVANRVHYKQLTEADYIQQLALKTKGVNRIANSFTHCLRMPKDATFERPPYRKKNHSRKTGAVETSGKGGRRVKKPSKTKAAPKENKPATPTTSFDGFFS